jgi:hypothetical protein
MIDDEMLKRLPETAIAERELVSTAFGISKTLQEKAAAIMADPDLSAPGKAKRVRELAMGAPVEHLRQLRSRAAAMSADITNQRAAMRPPTPDKTDVYAELQRRELRDHVRSLPTEQRLRAIMQDDAISEAILGAHHALSGLSTEQRDQVRKGYTERHFGEQLRQVEARQEILDTVNAAVSIASSQFAKVGGLDEQEIASNG